MLSRLRIALAHGARWYGGRAINGALGWVGLRLTRRREPTRPQTQREAVPLDDEHLRNCRVVTNREEMLRRLPKGGTVVELGVLGGDFSAVILEIVQPDKLYLVDLFWADDWQGAERFDRTSHRQFVEHRFQAEIADGRVVIEPGYSSEVLERHQDGTVDLVYVDADHSLASVRRDLDVAHRKLKPSGHIALNDYVFYDHNSMVEVGTVEAVHEFCRDRRYEMVFLALQGCLYNDVALRRLPAQAP